MSDPFAAYKLPSGMVKGTLITLTGTPAKFKVLLPGRSNEDFTMRLLARMSANGDVSHGVDPVAVQIERKKLFLDECILEASGLPDGMNATEFFNEYPLAARMLFERAQELAAKADEEVADAMEKLSPTQSGPRSGKGDSSNTKTSSKRVSSRGPKDQKSAA